MAPRGETLATAEDCRRKLVSAVFPELRYGDDPDLDRYLELRKDGRVADALSVYNGSLRARYPEDTERATLIALKRARDPRWIELQTRLLDRLALRLETRLAGNVSVIVSAMPRVASRDAWSSLGAVDSLLWRLGASGAPDRGIAAVEQHLRLVRLIVEADSTWQARAKGLEAALRLLQEYAALAHFEEADAQDFVARSRELEERKRSLSRPRAHLSHAEESTDFVARSRARRLEGKRDATSRFFDLERIKFSKAELAAIELRNPPSRHEDLVIAWCAKYWRAALDPRFERSVFLFSSKYRTRHFEIYRELRSARLRRRSDDEILTAMSSLLSTGYSYSVTGDLYMQRRWAAVKAGLYEAGTEAAAPANSQPGRRDGALAAATPGPNQPRVSNAAPEQLPSAAPPRVVPKGGTKRPPDIPPTHPTLDNMTGGSPKVGRRPGPRIPPSKPPAAAPSARASEPAPTFRKKSTREPTPLRKVPASSEPVGSLEKGTGGSISDRIRRLSGRRYDVYRNIFLERVRGSIRKSLLASRQRQGGLFNTSANEAEDVIYGFMAAHYEDPFMDWAASRERALVESLGFSMPQLDGIIEDCYRGL